MAKLGFHSHSTLFLLHTQIQNPLCHFHCSSISISNHHHRRRRLSSWQHHICRSRRWDPNAETYNNFNSEQTQDLDYSVDQWFDVLEDYVDSIWIFKSGLGFRAVAVVAGLAWTRIVCVRVFNRKTNKALRTLLTASGSFKVFGSFGWSLPFILSSLLLSTGPKAFLMALALPLGQSTLTFAFQKLLNKGKVEPRLNYKAKKGKSRANYGSRKGKLEEIAEWIGGRKVAKKKRKRYQKTPIFNGDVSVSSSSIGRNSDFGGWDELDEGIESSLGPTSEGEIEQK